MINTKAMNLKCKTYFRYPEAQEKVIAEIDSVFGDGRENDDVTMDDLRQLVYLEQVMKETLRKYPPAPLLVRTLTEDLEVEGHVVPKGSEVFVFVLIIHHNPAVWEDPELFDPDRFSKENMEKRHPYA